MSVSNPWAMHYQAVWHERTADRRLPAWLRVAFLAFAAHRRNGHARFKPGDVALVLGSVDRDTGEILPMNKHNVQRAIKSAVDAGWLAEGSSSLCLIVPAHAIQGGLGDPNERCPLHTGRARQARSNLRAVQ